MCCAPQRSPEEDARLLSDWWEGRAAKQRQSGTTQPIPIRMTEVRSSKTEDRDVGDPTEIPIVGNDRVATRLQGSAIRKATGEGHSHSARRASMVALESVPHNPVPVPFILVSDRRGASSAVPIGTRAAYGRPRLVITVVEPWCARSSNSGKWARASWAPHILGAVVFMAKTVRNVRFACNRQMLAASPRTVPICG